MPIIADVETLPVMTRTDGRCANASVADAADGIYRLRCMLMLYSASMTGRQKMTR